MRAYLSLLMVVALGMGLQAPVQAQTTTTTTKKEAKKTAKKTEVKTEVVKAEEVKPVEVKKEEEKKEEPAKVESKHKLSAYWGFDYVAEPLTDDILSSPNVLEKEYKKQRAIVYPGITYTYDKKWALGLYPEFRYNTNHQTGGYPTNPGRMEYARAIISLMRKGVLNEKDHGVGLEVGYVRRIFNKGVLENNGNHRLRTVFSKTINDKVSVSLFNELLFNATEDWTDTTWKFIDNIKPRVNVALTEKLALTFVYDINVSFYHRDQVGKHKKDFTSENHNIIAYTINDKYSVGTDFKYNYFYDRSGNPDQSLIIAPYTTVYVTPTTSISFEVAWTYSQANDNYDGFAPKRNFHQYPDLAIYFFQTLF